MMIARWLGRRYEDGHNRRAKAVAGARAFTKEGTATQTRIDNNIVLSRASSRRSLFVLLDRMNWCERSLFLLDRRYPVFKPLDRGQIAWQALMVLAVVLALVLMPYQICVPYYGFQRPFGHPLEIASTALDGILTVDIAVTFNVALLPRDANTEELVTDRRTIILTYLRTWFFPDLLASFPFSGVLWRAPGVARKGGRRGGFLEGRPSPIGSRATRATPRRCSGCSACSASSAS